MISNGADDSEVNVQILSLKRRAEALCEKHPGIDSKIEVEGDLLPQFPCNWKYIITIFINF